MSAKRSHSSRASAPLPEDEVLNESEQHSMSELSPEPRPIPRQTAYEVDRIGDILRRVREHRGEDLEAISEYLRIRPNYLIALENSRYEDLPADAYVIGFLRTYALYLGLDGKGAIDQYRREMAGRRRKPQLSMPQPMAEGRAPTVTVMVGTAIAALLVYSIWYGLSSPDTDATKKTALLPSTTTEKEAPPVNTEAKTDNTSLTATATSEGITLSVPASAVTATTATETKETPKENKDEAKPADLSATATQQATATPEPAKDTRSAKEKAKEEKAKEKEKAKEEKEKIKTEELPPPQATTTQPAAPSTQTTPSAATEPVKDTAADKEKGKTRVSLKAEKESWVLVTDSKGNTVFEKTLKAGETYSVPAGKGLKLTTGNAAGVSFSIDGSTSGKLGSSDTVARGVPLDPDKLKNRLSEGDSSSNE